MRMYSTTTTKGIHSFRILHSAYIGVSEKVAYDWDQTGKFAYCDIW